MALSAAPCAAPALAYRRRFELGRQREPMESTKGLRLGRYGRSVALVAVSVVLLAGLILAVVGPRQAVDQVAQLRDQSQARAGNLSGLAAAARDQRFGIAEGYKNQASKQ